MSKVLREKLRKEREFKIPVGKYVFTAMRPDDLDMLAINRMQVEDQIRRALELVVGWQNVTEDDLVGGATMDEVKFDSETFCAWASVRVAIWGPVTKALFDAYNAHTKTEDEAAKN